MMLTSFGSALAKAGYGKDIPPDSTLIFEVELMAITPK
jgi:FKBP-type peptidyl-prolyl cis-trans isomerase